MISKNRIKFVQSLHKKKYRQKYGQFTVEGEKSVGELIHSDYEIDEIFALSTWDVSTAKFRVGLNVTIVDSADLQKLSYFTNAASVVAVAHIPVNDNVSPTIDAWCLALDGINDPGNLGTIIRIADWYGIQHVVCSLNTVDLYNPKTISATMGSFTRCNTIHLDLMAFLAQVDVPKYYGLMVGQDVHKLKDPAPGIIVIGSEAHGIRPELCELPHNPITIFRPGNAESLNAAVAAGILCDRLIQ